jgi:hypothetical protein
VETGTEVLNVLLEKNPELHPNDPSKLLDFIFSLLANWEQQKIDLVQQTVAIINSDDLAQVTAALNMSDFGNNLDVTSKELDLSEQESQQLVIRSQESFADYRVNQITTKLLDQKIVAAPFDNVQDIVRNAFDVKVCAWIYKSLHRNWQKLSLPYSLVNAISSIAFCKKIEHYSLNR